MFNWLIGIISVMFIIFMVLCIYAGSFFINAAMFRNSPWYVNKGHKMLNPDNFDKKRTVYTDIEEQQTDAGHQFWENEFTSDYSIHLDGETLWAREFKRHPTSHQWIIAVHGYRSSGKRDMAFPTKKFVEAGYNVLVPDLRAHGKSTGEKIGMGWLEKEDVKAWVNQLIEQDEEAEITLFGGSMGAATVMMTSGDILPHQVQVLVADCGYTSVYGEFSQLLKSALHLPPVTILYFANMFNKKRLGFDLREASSFNQLKKNQLPLLLIHGTKDKFVPYQDQKVNLMATQGVRDSLLVRDAPHLSSWVYEEENYFNRVFQFIENNSLEDRHK